MKAPGKMLFLLLMVLFLATGCSSRYTGDYQKGISAFSAGDYALAAKIFSQCDPQVGNAGTYAAYSQGMVFWEQGQYSAAAPYFETCDGFMYGTQRYRYCNGVQLLEKGDAASAQQVFEELGDFEDAPQMASYSLGCTSEKEKDYETALAAYEDAGNVMDAGEKLLNLQTQIYSRAIELKNQGDYGNALILFNYLGSYLRSEEYARDCHNRQRDEIYTQAETLENQGELQQAYDKFKSLGVYRDAAERSNTLAKKLGIPIVDETRPYQ